MLVSPALPSAVIGPGWVDHRTLPIMGLFPLSVERHVNGAVADHAFGVTTVTRAAQYYALHGMIAEEADSRGLSLMEARSLLRRCEVVYAAACLAHVHSHEHPKDWAIDPHGADFLRPRLAAGPIDLNAMSEPGSGTYAKAGWGFAGAYRGSELILGILRDATHPGPNFDQGSVRETLGSVLDAARADSIDNSSAGALGEVCLCRTATAPDADWLASQFTGDVTNVGTQGAVLGQTAALIKSAVTHANIDSEGDLRNYISYSPLVPADAEQRDFPVFRRWRGIVLRSKAVEAWRELWGLLCDQIAIGGTASRSELEDWLAGAMPAGTLRDFAAGLPPTQSPDGDCLSAELDVGVSALSDEIRCLAVLFLSASREQELDGDEGLGFRGPRRKPEAVEELSPHWIVGQLDAWGDRPTTDFAARLVDVLLDRSQRIALRKSRFDHDKGTFTFPARVIVRDDLIFRLYSNGNHRMPLRITQLMSMGEQTGLFARDPVTRRWTLGPRGDVVA